MGELEGGAVDDAQTLAMMTDELMAKFDQLVELEPAVEGYGPYGPWILLTRGTLICVVVPSSILSRGRALLYGLYADVRNSDDS